MRGQAAKLTTAALMAALTAAGAFLVLPIGPVPVTMQTCVVFMAGAVLGSRWGALSQTAYVLMGLIGLPVFAGGRGGLGVVLSPTFGYLIGFIPAAFVTGRGVERRSPAPWRRLVVAMAGGLAVLYACGVAYLYIYLNRVVGQPSSWPVVLNLGLWPFLPFDALKIALAAAVTLALQRRRPGDAEGARPVRRRIGRP